MIPIPEVAPDPERDARAIERIDELTAQGYGDKPVHLDWLEDPDVDVIAYEGHDDEGTEDDR